ncbi:MAG: polymerase sigma factor RpoE [Labilithrix sp.]|nr:polymerase sigma factor RpoE [Labilithrix sp.]
MEDGVVTEQARKARLDELVDQYFSDVWRFLRHLGVPPHSVDDATQDVFLVAARRVEEIMPGRERSFLFGTAYKVAQTERRKFARAMPHDDAEHELDRAPTPEEHLDDKQAASLALRLLDELDEAQRQVFVLFEIEGLTMQQIADLIELPLGTVASRLRRAREEFQTRFERHRNSLRGAK